MPPLPTPLGINGSPLLSMKFRPPTLILSTLPSTLVMISLTPSIPDSYVACLTKSLVTSLKSELCLLAFCSYTALENTSFTVPSSETILLTAVNASVASLAVRLYSFS